MEIAFWEPIIALDPEEQREKMSQLEVINSASSATWWEAILKTAKKELAPEMGGAYRDAVLLCLNASGEGLTGSKASGGKSGILVIYNM